MFNEFGLDPQTTERMRRNALRQGDVLSLLPFQGRSRRLRLNRTRYEFRSSLRPGIQQDDTLIELQSTSLATFGVELVLVRDPQHPDDDQCAQYRLRSLDQRPFRINGTWCPMAWPQRGDILELGHNRVTFLAPPSTFDLGSEDQEAQKILDNQEFLRSPLSLLIEGETGTGKTRLARQVHELSQRQGRFVHINLAAFSQGLIESELFGHVRGAFTGAVAAKQGALVEAHRGTLFLDEVDSLAPELQTKLLLFLDEKTVRPVGGQDERKVDVRVLAASGRPMLGLVEEGKIRKDFYFRLSAGAAVKLAPLRERPEAVRSLAMNFAQEHGLTLDEEALELYQRCPWPGNVRQLLGHLEKKRFMGNGPRLGVGPHDEMLLNQMPTPTWSAHGGVMTMQQVKRDYAQKVLRLCEGKVAEASKILDLAPSTVRQIVRP